MICLSDLPISVVEEEIKKTKKTPKKKKPVFTISDDLLRQYCIVKFFIYFLLLFQNSKNSKNLKNTKVQKIQKYFPINTDQIKKKSDDIGDGFFWK